ncbi:unnamed protein product [Diplocarpon coronariae]
MHPPPQPHVTMMSRIRIGATAWDPLLTNRSEPKAVASGRRAVSSARSQWRRGMGSSKLGKQAADQDKAEET